MSRIFLCGTTSKEFQNMKELTDPIYNHIDGLLYTIDDGAFQDGTYELLNERKGEGALIHRNFVKNHSYSHNHWLLDSGVLKTGDVFIMRDSQERFHPEWASKIRNFIDTLVFGGVKTAFNYNKLFFAVYNDSMEFVHSPHWALKGWQQKAIEMSNHHNENLKEWTWRLRDGEEGGRPIDNKIDHEAKYYWCYGNSNHLLLGRENNIEEYQRLEIIRLHVRDQARLLGFDMTLQGLEDFMRWMTDEEREEQTRLNGLNWINSCSILKNFYRKHIAKESWDNIISTENTWALEYE